MKRLSSINHLDQPHLDYISYEVKIGTILMRYSGWGNEKCQRIEAKADSFWQVTFGVLYKQLQTSAFQCMNEMQMPQCNWFEVVIITNTNWYNVVKSHTWKKM